MTTNEDFERRRRQVAEEHESKRQTSDGRNDETMAAVRAAYDNLKARLFSGIPAEQDAARSEWYRDLQDILPSSRARLENLIDDPSTPQLSVYPDDILKKMGTALSDAQDVALGATLDPEYQEQSDGDLWGAVEETLWIAENWIPRGDMVMLSGMGGVGKSWIAMQLAVLQALGKPYWFLDDVGETYIPLDTSMRVFYAHWDDVSNTIRKRVRGITGLVGEFARDGTKVGDPLNGLTARNVNRLGTNNGVLWETQRYTNQGFVTEAGERLRSRVLDGGFDVLILDTLSNAQGGVDEINNAQITPMLASWRNWATENKVTLILLGHTAKDPDSTYRGGTSYQNSVRVHILLKYLKGKDIGGFKYYKLSIEKANGLLIPDPIYLRREPGGFVVTENPDVINGRYAEEAKAERDEESKLREQRRAEVYDKAKHFDMTNREDQEQRRYVFNTLAESWGIQPRTVQNYFDKEKKDRKKATNGYTPTS